MPPPSPRSRVRPRPSLPVLVALVPFASATASACPPTRFARGRRDRTCLQRVFSVSVCHHLLLCPSGATTNSSQKSPTDTQRGTDTAWHISLSVRLRRARLVRTPETHPRGTWCGKFMVMCVGWLLVIVLLASRCYLHGILRKRADW